MEEELTPQEDPNQDSKKKKKEIKMMNPEEVKDLINQKTGHKNAYNLNSDNPTEVAGWIPSRNRLLDSNICEGRRAGLPKGRISMYAAESGVGKSFLAIEHCVSAIDDDIDVVYFCSEPGGIEKEFLEKVLGTKRMNRFTYVEVTFMEEVFETIEALLVNTKNKYLFVWDSLAATPSKHELEGGFDASMFFAVGAKAATLGLKKLMVPLSKRECTFLILNQVRENIEANKYDKMVPAKKWKIPGGKMVVFCCSLVIILEASPAKSNALLDESGEKVGKYGKAHLIKSRFRTEGRSIPIGFTWAGDKPHFHDEELWFEALKERGYIVRNKLTFADGTDIKVSEESWMDRLTDKKFKDKVEALLDEAFIFNYKENADG